jgi:Dockerin type I domain
MNEPFAPFAHLNNNMDSTKSNEPGADGLSEAPPKLQAALRQLTPRPVFVPPALDDAVLHAARRQLVRPRHTRLPWLPLWLLWPSLAAASAVLALVVWTVHRAPAFARDDVNHDGRVDILDAFQLARQLESGARPPASLDLNGDGVVDRRDVEIIAARAVTLGKGKRS